MSDNVEKNPEQEESFAELFEQYSSGLNQELNQGDLIKGEVISIGTSSVYVDTGTKSDGVVDKAELLDENGELPLSIGDKIELYVVSVTESEVILSKALSGASNDQELYDAFKSRTPVEGKVKEVIKGGFHIDISGKRGFCPISQIDVSYVDNPETYLNETLTFFITRYEEKGRNIVLSRRDYLAIDIEKKKAEFLDGLSEGDTVEATITKLMPYGAFAELIKGVEGMIHVSELSWSRIEKPEEAVQPGDHVQVKVLAVKHQDDGKNPKISLSIKQTSNDPWELAGTRFHVGDQLSGKIMRCASFGAFVEIAPGTEGLVHVSEMSYVKRILKPEDAVSVGDVVQVVIKDIDMAKKRISLSMRDAMGDPWNGIDMKYPLGKPVQGKLEKKESFGFFICLEPGVTGLLPKSKINQSNLSAEMDKLKPGDSLSVVVESIEEDKRRISFNLAQSETQDDWKSFAPSASKNMGTMGELLQQAMNKNKD